MDTSTDTNDEFHTDFFNIFLCYYKKLYEKKETTHFFDGVNSQEQNSTNRCMELLFEQIADYKENSHNLHKQNIYDPDDPELKKFSSEESIYTLAIDSDNKKISGSIIPLITYLTELDWRQLNWNLYPLRTNYD